MTFNLVILSQTNYESAAHSINKLYPLAEKRGAVDKGNTLLKRKQRKERKMKAKMKQKANKIKGQTADVTNCVKVCTMSCRRFIVDKIAFQ